MWGFRVGINGGVLGLGLMVVFIVCMYVCMYVCRIFMIVCICVYFYQCNNVWVLEVGQGVEQGRCEEPIVYNEVLSCGCGVKLRGEVAGWSGEV